MSQQCKNCGKSLPEGSNLNFCSKNCKDEYKKPENNGNSILDQNFQCGSGAYRRIANINLIKKALEHKISVEEIKRKGRFSGFTEFRLDEYISIAKEMLLDEHKK